MINNVTTITEADVWTTICQLEANKKYQLSFVPTAISSVDIHLHESDGVHYLTLRNPGTAMMAGFEYSYILTPDQSGELVLRTNHGEVHSIVVEEK